MARTNFTDSTGLLCWFDPARSTAYTDGRTWNGENHIGNCSGSQWVDETLYRTAGGRWVLNRDATRYNHGADAYRYLTDSEAQDWLIRSDSNEDALTQWFGPVEEERGPGRPVVGDQVNIAFPADLLAQVDAAAVAAGLTRSEWVRRAARAAL